MRMLALPVTLLAIAAATLSAPAQDVGAGVHVGPIGAGATVGSGGVGAGAHVGDIGASAGLHAPAHRFCHGGWYWRHHHHYCRRW